ncbi:ImuA family protein [Teichococcus vastitatis]|uniref:Damage-inducible mutagenesis protein n=1 Tax=Teichococcus vastitatis TaxID=2307076 RepID=A0ABS9WE32_9PROT|nr:damage-inducible mutagenesis protein [Pseudoroseomonas vastitatis]MCI0757135.1 damage-inducible mutagenesis protein [Pseudoroseomonas vastitatis]
MASLGTSALLDGLREQVARIEGQGEGHNRPVIPFGIPALDGGLPRGGMARGALHEVAGAGANVEHASAATLLVAGILARGGGPVLWASERFDLFAPGLAGAGLQGSRVVHVEAGSSVLLAMEEGLRHPGLAGVVGEYSGRLGLTASRRLQLAAESSGAMAFLVRRGPRLNDLLLSEPTAAVTRWKVACLPSPPPLAHSPGTPGLGRALWQLDLMRCRGGVPGSWTVEACDAQGRLALPAVLADRPAAATPGRVHRRAAPGRAAA